MSINSIPSKSGRERRQGYANGAIVPMHATAQGASNIVAMLLPQAANSDLQHKAGLTPLTLAIETGHDAAPLLVETPQIRLMQAFQQKLPSDGAFSVMKSPRDRDP